MTVLLIGDVHNEFDALDEIVKDAKQRHNGITAVIQVGDTCLGYQTGRASKWVNGIHPRLVQVIQDSYLDWVIVPGNHDNWDAIQYGLNIPAGLRLHCVTSTQLLEIEGCRMLLIPGACSLGPMFSGETWNPSVKESDIEHAIALASLGNIDYVFSHEASSTFLHDLGFSIPRITPSGEKFARLAKTLQSVPRSPKAWLFGHYHTAKEFQIPTLSGGMRVGCVGLLTSRPKWSAFKHSGYRTLDLRWHTMRVYRVRYSDPSAGMTIAHDRNVGF